MDTADSFYWPTPTIIEKALLISPWPRLVSSTLMPHYRETRGHLDRGEPMTSPLIPDDWHLLPDEFRIRIGERVGRQRLMATQGHLLLILHRVPEAHEVKREGHLFWKRSDGTWLSNAFQGHPEPLLAHLVEYEHRLDTYEELEDNAESAQDYFDVLEGLSPLYRAIQHLHQVLQEAREKQPDDREIIILRDRAYAVERNAELLYIETKNALEFMVAKQAETLTQSSHSMAVSSHRLNILAAFFFPITVITAMVGVSYREVAAGAFPLWGFLLTMVAGVALGALLTYLITRKAD